MLRNSYLKPIKQVFSLNNGLVVIATTMQPLQQLLLHCGQSLHDQISQATPGITRSHIPCYYRNHLELFCATLRCVNQQQAIRNFIPLLRSHTFTKKKAKSSKMKVITIVQSKNLERFVRTEISFALTKNGGSMLIGLGGRSFPVVRLAGWLAGRQTKFSLGC